MHEKLNFAPGAHGAVWFYRSRDTSVRPRHTHRELELNLVVAGRASYVLGDRRYELFAHDLVWLFPAQEHQLIERSADYEMWIAVFAPAPLRALVKGTDAAVLAEQDPTGSFCRTLAPANAVALARHCAELLAPGSMSLFNAGLAHLALRSWDRFNANRDSPSYHTLHPAVENALGLLRAGKSDASLDELAARAGLSPARLSRRFKAEIGLGIAEYRNRVRLERFLELYGAGQRLTTLAAAHGAGFQSYAQFHRVFKRLMGHGPAEHRRRQTKQFQTRRS